MKSNPKCFKILILIVVLFESRVRSDKTCETTRIDAITPLDNKTFAVFRKSDVWLWNKQSKDMTGESRVPHSLTRVPVLYNTFLMMS
jgi:hypothetical protein